MNRIKECRLKKGMSQKFVALSLGVKPPTVWGWENDKFAPTQENLSALADLFGVSVDYLLGREDDSPRPGWIKITPTMAGEAGIIPEGAVRVGNVSRTFAESEEAKQFKVVPEVTGNPGAGKSSMISGDWYPSAPPQPSLVLDGDPVSGWANDRPETQAIARELYAMALNIGATKEDVDAFRNYMLLTKGEQNYINASMKVLRSQRKKEE